MTSETMPDVSLPAHRYTAELAGELESAWQRTWSERGTFHADNPVGDLAGEGAQREPFFLLDMFPYPSGKGLHVGHPLGYIATDVVARYQRMKGKNVAYTMGYDAFGLPAEQYAVQTGQHPRITTDENVANMRRQLARIGLSHDLRRSVATTDEEFVRWTQWIFLQVYSSWYDPEATRHDGKQGSARPISDLIKEFTSGERTTPDGRPFTEYTEAERASLIDSYRLAYIDYAPVNWCPGLGTVLANEEVTSDGRSERGNYPVFASRLRQWMMRITAYADRLADDLDTIDWPEKIRSMQRNWIGRSDGATVAFTVPAGDGREASDLQVFTTRPDTLFGATFMVIGPEHPLLGEDSDHPLVPALWPAGTREAWKGGALDPAEAVRAYRAQAANRSEAERQDEERVKTGVFTGIFGINPVNGKQVPIFVADYVLMGYGTGAIMAVPAHDERDHAFAKRFDLPITATIDSPDGAEDAAYTGDGIIINSANDELSLNGMNKDEAKAAMTAWLEKKGLGKATTTYRLRDWLFSRQRYWGEPFPVVYDEVGRVHALPEDMLPVTLPEMDDFSPRTFDPEDATSAPEPPLGRATDWLNVELDLGDGPKTYRRDTNTMPQWAGSCWYEMRYLDPNNDDAFIAPENEAYWMGPRTPGGAGGADLYVGGVEHAVLHLLYARFWHKVLYDLGYVSSFEPFHRLFNQGYIQAYAYTDARGQYVPADEVKGDETTGFTWQGEVVTREYGKMGKSLKNIVTPDDMCETYGADTFRIYEMSMGPLDLSRPWETRAVVGSQRFLQRLWRNVIDENTGEVTVTDDPMDEVTERLLARTIADVTEELDNLRMNTAIAKMIVLNNHLTSLPAVPRAAIEPLVLMVSPLAPHIAEELWQRLGHDESLAREPFPVADESKLVEETVTCVVQIAGKVRDRLEVLVDIADDELAAKAIASAGAQRYLQGREPMKVIVRAPKLVNLVPPRD
ncbi:leucine--tRNA ligase [Bowdeniella nasicola]|uniref:Leucine--tRNA ligase n=1 Tax=Bowdeniella nasicola TaxID=208480 RepID=A0A1Q5Q4H8_9ACTO|nr:class I tRNA ligase family protein [Bowdeniella nasicola]OKL54734.1 leucine--tRNA ligase [Bowdeniella nasicola]